MQLRFMLYVTFPLIVITVVMMVGLYIGIWGSMLDAFSNEQLRNDLLTASRLTEYESARETAPRGQDTSLNLFLKAEKLSSRQREVFKEILDEANARIIPKFILLLFFIAWLSVFISHKVAGPFYRFHTTFDEILKGNMRTRIHLRKADECKSLAGRFNDALTFLDTTFARLKNIIRENKSEPERMTDRLKEELSKIKTSADS